MCSAPEIIDDGSDKVLKVLLSNHRIFSGEGVKTTEEDCVRGMGRHLNISDLKITTLRNREEVQDHINDTDLVFCLVTCVILCPWPRALEAGIPTPEVLNPALKLEVLIFMPPAEGRSVLAAGCR